MKNSILTLLLSVVTFSFASAQHKAKSTISVITVTTMHNELVKGIFYSMNDTSVLLYIGKSSNDMKNLASDSLSLTSITCSAILRIKVRRKNSPLIGTFAGAAGGLTFGFALDALTAASSAVLSGILLGPDEATTVTPIFTIAFGLVGATSGYVSGALGKKIEIHGSQSQFNEERKLLLKYAYK